MIVFDLSCASGHSFEGWFGSSDDYTRQQARGLVTCPQCGSADISKAPMAPAVGKKSSQQPAAAATPTRQVANAPMPPQVVEALKQLADAQARALKDSTWVGRDFAEQSRAMHYGERDHAPIHGEASPAEAKALAEERVPVAALPFRVAPPDELN